MPIQSKIEVCGSALLHWGNHFSRDFRARILDYKKKMASLRGKHDSASVDCFFETRKRYNELLHSHETFWKQRAKSNWLREGDMNSRYFHAMASAQKKQNAIGKLRNSQGQWCTNPEDINEIITNYFTQIFSTEGGFCGEALQWVEPSISAEQNLTLLENFNKADVREAIFSMHPDKSPGPDASDQEAHVMKAALTLYGVASGQRVNFNKSSISFSVNTITEVELSICSILGVRGTVNHGNYLGLPSFIGRSKEILLKIVAQALPIYVMNVTSYPWSFVES
ncbi:uncharacterized protein LOC127899993 [Citrus sinensis]|uniref:uncharacterized protein LOC127899993 n=1 Tax=Citrus sinensis TaxID=2711 RepID=UPI002277B7DC|nr:uncharacterized protein LOC127899993 [Citrus sinensis]